MSVSPEFADRSVDYMHPPHRHLIINQDQPTSLSSLSSTSEDRLEVLLCDPAHLSSNHVSLPSTPFSPSRLVPNPDLSSASASASASVPVPASQQLSFAPRAAPLDVPASKTPEFSAFRNTMNANPYRREVRNNSYTALHPIMHHVPSPSNKPRKLSRNALMILEERRSRTGSNTGSNTPTRNFEPILLSSIQHQQQKRRDSDIKLSTILYGDPPATLVNGKKSNLYTVQAPKNQADDDAGHNDSSDAEEDNVNDLGNSSKNASWFASSRSSSTNSTASDRKQSIHSCSTSLRKMIFSEISKEALKKEVALFLQEKSV